MINIREDNMDA